MGHWITLHEHDSEEGTVHIFLGEGGQVTKGPASLIGSNIKHLSQHGRVEHHTGDAVAEAARKHPTYTEHNSERKIHVFGRNGPGLGYDVTVHEPPPALTEDQTAAGVAEARRVVRPDAARTAPTAIPPGPPHLEYHPDTQEAASLALIAKAHGRVDELRRAHAAIPDYGGSAAYDRQSTNAEIHSLEKRAAPHQQLVADAQYGRLDRDAKASVANSLGANGRIDTFLGGHATPEQVDNLLNLFHRVPEQEHTSYLNFLHREAGKNDAFNEQVNTKFSPMAYAVAASMIREHLWGKEEPLEGESVAPVPSTPPKAPKVPRFFRNKRVVDPHAAPVTHKPVAGISAGKHMKVQGRYYYGGNSSPEVAQAAIAHAYAHGLLTPDQRAGLEAHVTSDPAKAAETPLNPAEVVGALNTTIATNPDAASLYKPIRTKDVTEFWRQHHAMVDAAHAAGHLGPNADAARAALKGDLGGADTYKALNIAAAVHGASPPAGVVPERVEAGQLAGQAVMPDMPASTAGAPATQGGFVGLPPPTASAAPVPKELPGQSGMFKPAIGGSPLIPHGAAMNMPPALPPRIDRLRESKHATYFSAALTPQTYSHGSTQINVPEPLAARIRDVGKAFRDEELGEDGREVLPHVTVQYGVDPETPEDLDRLRIVCAEHAPFRVRIGKQGQFSGANAGKPYDVVHLAAHSPGLHTLRSAIRRSVPTVDTHATYRPHITVAYVKSGLGRRPLDTRAVTGSSFPVTHLQFSDAGGKTMHFPLGTAIQAGRPKRTSSFSLSHLWPWRAKNMPTVTMSNLSAEERRTLPASDFGWPDGPHGPEYPIMDASDVGAAASLIGKAPPDQQARIKRRIISIAKRKGFPIPDAWKSPDATHSAEMALFALGEEVSHTEDWVYRTGKLFEVGDFPDKHFSMSEAEMDAAIEAFALCPVDLEHTKTPLSGKLGQVECIWREGNALFGEVAIPRWLDSALEGTGRKVSATWDRATKRLKAVALVVSPRVPDAALMSAYAAFNTRHDTPQGQAAMQALHDCAASYGATCKTGNVQMHSRHEVAGIQAMHDLACQHGARCAAVSRGGIPSGGPRGIQSSGGVHMHMDSLKFWKTGGRRFREEARIEGITSVPDEEVFSALAEAEEDERAAVRAEMAAEFSARIASAEAKERAAQEALFAATAQRLQGEAAAFADGLIAGNKLMPAEREGLIGALTQAGMDDAAHGTVNFSSGAGGSRVEQLRALYQARPAHTLTQEQIRQQAAQGGQVLFNQTTTPGVSDTDEPTHSAEDLLKMTPAGKSALSAKNGRHN